MSLLEVRDLRVGFRTRKGVMRAVDGVSFSVEEGRTLAVVGESGSGKSVTAMSILRLLDENGYIESGEILFEEEGEQTDLVRLSLDKMYGIRGNRISMIFQEPMTALNPVFTIGRQVAEPFLIHQDMTKRESYAAAAEILKSVQISNVQGVMQGYSHQLSGGMRQRVMIAMALACRPKLLIADEPTTALDVTIQAQILRLMSDLQKENKTAVLFITHDLGVVNEVADDVAVLYCGQVVELAPAPAVFQGDGYSHPYTEGLLNSSPDGKKAGKRLDSIPGNVPSPFEMPSGCRFAPRCKYCTEKCIREEPPLLKIGEKHSVRCFYPKKEERSSDRHKRLVVRNST